MTAPTEQVRSRGKTRSTGRGNAPGDSFQRADEFLHRHGRKAVLLGRFTAVLCALTPGVAGAAHMPYLRTFLPWNVAGATMWGGDCVLLGYAFSVSLTTVDHYLVHVPIVVAVVAYVLVRRARARR